MSKATGHSIIYYGNEMNTKNYKKAAQSGFTLVELIIVIVILGILAAVAIPKLTDTSGAAVSGVASATQGALKSAWSSAYAVTKGVAPTSDQIAAQMSDPQCASAADGTITCTGVFKPDGTTQYIFSTGVATNTAVVLTPSTITISNP
jgi:prepilin-type N-terminal cleavage/methylation domain-containing protein